MSEEVEFTDVEFVVYLNDGPFSRYIGTNVYTHKVVVRHAKCDSTYEFWRAFELQENNIILNGFTANLRLEGQTKEVRVLSNQIGFMLSSIVRAA